MDFFVVKYKGLEYEEDKRKEITTSYSSLPQA